MSGLSARNLPPHPSPGHTSPSRRLHSSSVEGLVDADDEQRAVLEQAFMTSSAASA